MRTEGEREGEEGWGEVYSGGGCGKKSKCRARCESLYSKKGEITKKRWGCM